MASAGPSPLECPICTELYDDSHHQPKLLTCHHTLCLSCIVLLANGSTVQCPNKCKLATTLPNLSCEEQERLKTEKETVTQRAKKLQYSFYIDIIRENERFQQLALTQNQPILCLSHNKKQQDIWCKTCQRAICVRCQFTSHKGHDHDLFDNVAETFIEQLDKNLEKIKTQMQKLQSGNSSNSLKQQYMENIDKQFDQLYKDFTKLTDIKKQAIKNEISLGVDEYVNIQMTSLESMHSIYQQAVNSFDVMVKVHVSGSSDLENGLDKLMNLSLTTDSRTTMQIQQYSSNIKQGIHGAIESVEMPMLSHQLVNVDPKESNTLTDKASHQVVNTDMNSSPTCRAPVAPANPITNRPVGKIGGKGSGSCQVLQPRSIATDSAGNIYVLGGETTNIQKLNSAGNYVTSWKTDDSDYGTIAVNDRCNKLVSSKFWRNRKGGEIVIYSLDGQVDKNISISDIGGILGVAVNSHGHIVCSDVHDNIIHVVGWDGNVLRRFGSKGSGPGQFQVPWGVCIGSDDDIVVADSGNHRIQIFDHQGQFKLQFGTEGDENGQFQSPVGVVVDQYQQILVCDVNRNNVQLFSYAGEFITCIDSKDQKMFHPRGVALTQDNHVLVTDYSCLFKFKYM